MDINKLKNADYLDILFDGRNKKYGSYELRKKYAQRAAIGGLLSILLVGGGFALTFIKPKPAPSEDLTVSANVNLKNIQQTPPPKKEEPKPEKPKEIPKPHKESSPAQMKGKADPTETPKFKETQKFTKAEVQKDNKVDPSKVLEQMKKDADAGAISMKGDKDGFPRGMSTEKSGTGTHGGLINSEGAGHGGAGDKPTSDPSPTYQVAKKAEPGYDIGAWLGRNLEYTEDAKRNEIQGKIWMQIVVGVDGKVSDVTILGRKLGYGLDDAAINVVKRKLPKFSKPAFNQAGQPIPSYYKFPISYTLPD